MEVSIAALKKRRNLYRPEKEKGIPQGSFFRTNGNQRINGGTFFIFLAVEG